MLHRRIVIFLVYSLLTYAQASFLGINDEACSTPENFPGKCISIRNCPTVNNILINRPISPINNDFLLKSTCGFQGTIPLVCCSLKDYLTNQTNTTQDNLLNLNTTKNSFLPDLSVCGKFVAPRNRGPEQQLGAFPWLALLQYETSNGTEFHCGGVLINQRYVLTAAHCVSPTYFADKQLIKTVRLGDHNIKDEPDCETIEVEMKSFTQCSPRAIDVAIETITTHPAYNDRDMLPDIALIRLQKNIVYNDFLKPICLEAISENQVNNLISGDSALAVGWGANEYNVPLKRKHQMTMQIQRKNCVQDYPEIASRLKDQLCTTPVREKVSYFGDEGGALHGWNANENYFAIGIMSFRYFKEPMENLPVVYSTIRNTIPWILTNMKE